MVLSNDNEIIISKLNLQEQDLILKLSNIEYKEDLEKIVENEEQDLFLNKLKDKEEKLILMKYFYTFKYLKDEEIIDKNKYNQVLSIRKELYEYYITLYSYRLELVCIEELLDRKIFEKNKYKFKYPMNLDVTKIHILRKIEEELYKEKNKNMLNAYFLMLIRAIPFKLSKYKYYDHVEKMLNFNLRGKSKEYVLFEIERYKRTVTAMLSFNYGIYFPNYFTKIESFKRLNFEDYSFEELKKIHEDIILEIKDIDSTISDIRDLGLLTNKLSLLSKYGEKTEFINKNKEDIKNDLFTVLREIQEVSKKSIDTYSPKAEEELLIGRNMLMIYNDNVFMPYDVLSLVDTEPIDDELLEKIIENFIEYLTRNINPLDRDMRKIKMKILLSNLNPSFKSIEDFMKYMNYSLDNRVCTEEELGKSLTFLQEWMSEIRN